MPNHRPLPAFERLHELLEIVPIAESQYGTHSGLIWKVRRKGTKGIGSVAGSPKPHPKDPARIDWKVMIDGTNYFASRIIFMLMRGFDPGELTIDHEDQNSLNNNVWNLRIADHVLQANNRKQGSTNSSGATGVSWNKDRGKWRVQLRCGSKNRFLGRYTCLIEAARVWNNKVIELGFDTLGKPLNDLEALSCSCGCSIKS
jgi:hypothetical protein